jgi:uncharacterized protein (TIGR02246 family)
MVILLAASSVALAASGGGNAGDEAAIRKTIESYVKVFNRGDAKALAAHWTSDGSYFGPDGERFTGRKQLEAAFKAFFEKNKGIKLKVRPIAIYVQSPSEAIEEGTATTTKKGEDPQSTRYVAAYAKVDGEWKITRIREIYPVGTSSHYEKLKGLEWLIGDWVDRDSTGKLETRCYWSTNRNYLVRSFSVTDAGRPAFQGKQIIGWDPATKRIRSWVFDSNGGFGEGTWTKHGKSWYVNAKMVLNTGEKASSINILTPADDNSFTWQATGRETAGELLPDTSKVTVVRKQAASTPAPAGDK